MRQPVPASVLVSYVAFVLVGVSAGVGGVLLLAQMGDYGVDRATIGIIFFTGSAGFVAASLSTGALIHRFGVRLTLAAGGTACVLAGLCLAARPPFVAFVLVQLVVGYGAGILRVGAQRLSRGTARCDIAAEPLARLLRCGGAHRAGAGCLDHQLRLVDGGLADPRPGLCPAGGRLPGGLPQATAARHRRLAGRAVRAGTQDGARVAGGRPAAAGGAVGRGDAGHLRGP